MFHFSAPSHCPSILISCPLFKLYSPPRIYTLHFNHWMLIFLFILPLNCYYSLVILWYCRLGPSEHFEHVMLVFWLFPHEVEMFLKTLIFLDKLIYQYLQCWNLFSVWLCPFYWQNIFLSSGWYLIHFFLLPGRCSRVYLCLRNFMDILVVFECILNIFYLLIWKYTVLFIPYI